MTETPESVHVIKLNKFMQIDLSFLGPIDPKINNQVNRNAARQQTRLDEFDAWMSRQKWPLKRRALGKYSRFKLAVMKRAGIKYVQLLGCNCENKECDACRAMKVKIIPIDTATALPLEDCDQKFCRCLWLARKGPNPL